MSSTDPSQPERKKPADHVNWRAVFGEKTGDRGDSQTSPEYEDAPASTEATGDTRDPSEASQGELQGKTLPKIPGEMTGAAGPSVTAEDPKQEKGRTETPEKEQKGAIDLVALRALLQPKDLDPITFEDIKGQDEAVTKVQNHGRKIKKPHIFDKWGAKSPRAFIFVGPPGTGKTMLATALANSGDFAFLTASASDLGSKMYGESEKLARALFTVADIEAQEHSSGKCVVFVDEVEVLARKRDGNSNEASDRSLTEWLQCLNGMKSTGNVIFVCASNFPELIDSAFMDRMNDIIEVGLPTAEGVSAILEHRFRKREKGEHQILEDDVNFVELGELLVGVSGRTLEDLANAVVDAKANLEYEQEEHLENGEITEDEIEEIPPVDAGDIIEAVVNSDKFIKKLGEERIKALCEQFDIEDEGGSYHIKR